VLLHQWLRISSGNVIFLKDGAPTPQPVVMLLKGLEHCVLAAINQVQILGKAGCCNFILVVFDNTYSIILFINYMQ
jgi:hypothetical protein